MFLEQMRQANAPSDTGILLRVGVDLVVVKRTMFVGLHQRDNLFICCFVNRELVVRAVEVVMVYLGLLLL